jgi:hypothetical protein
MAERLRIMVTNEGNPARSSITGFRKIKDI